MGTGIRSQWSAPPYPRRAEHFVARTAGQAVVSGALMSYEPSMSPVMSWVKLVENLVDLPVPGQHCVSGRGTLPERDHVLAEISDRPNS